MAAINVGLGQTIDAAKLENNYKLTPLLNRRSYNEHKGSDNFINLLDENSRFTGAARASFLEQNINLPNVVLRNGVKLLHSNEEDNRCLPSKEFFQRSAQCFKTTLPDNMSVDVASQSEFASQTLKPISAQNVAEWVAFDEAFDCQNVNVNYKLKETSPGCLPGKKSKSKKFQRKGSYKTQQEFYADAPNDNKESERDLASVSEENRSNKVGRRSSFISSVIKFAKFGRKKKRPSEQTQETSDDSNWGTESSEEKRDKSSFLAGFVYFSTKTVNFVKLLTTTTMIILMTGACLRSPPRTSRNMTVQHDEIARENLRAQIA
jgi:hypothetical protein